MAATPTVNPPSPELTGDPVSATTLASVATSVATGPTQARPAG